MEYLLLLLGFSLLIFSGRLLITCSVSLARRLKLSPFVIGLTVVAVGTSAPELLVSLTGAIKGHADVAVYNVIGSNITNVLLVLAFAALIIPIPLRSRNLWLDGSAMVFFSLLVWVFMLDLKLTRAEGGLMLGLLIVYILASFKWSGGKKTSGSGEYGSPEAEIRHAGNNPGMLKVGWALAGVAAASGGLAFGAGLLVDNAVLIAREIGLSERIISATMIAVGTSIPEMTTSVIAAFRKETDISIGNIMGSNVFNIGFVLGITAVVNPLRVNPLVLEFDVFWLVGVAVLPLVLILLPRRSMLSRWKGLAMLLLYLVYLHLILN